MAARRHTHIDIRLYSYTQIGKMRIGRISMKAFSIDSFEMLGFNQVLHQTALYGHLFVNGNHGELITLDR